MRPKRAHNFLVTMQSRLDAIGFVGNCGNGPIEFGGMIGFVGNCDNGLIGFDGINGGNGAGLNVFLAVLTAAEVEMVSHFLMFAPPVSHFLMFAVLQAVVYECVPSL